VTYAEQQSYLTISARVATDLKANDFWEALDFVAVRSEEGGATTGRRINIRVRELETPTLFTNVHDPAPAALLLPKPEQPTYVIDVNVFLDIVKDRQRAESAKRLVTAAMSGILRLFATHEFVQELSRAAKDAQNDPVLHLATALPQFPEVPGLVLEELKRDLAGMIFPGRGGIENLRPREVSDLRHLATTIHHRAAGFVTSDEAILRKREELRRKFSIEVVGPAELAELYVPNQWMPAQADVLAHGGSALEVAEMPEEHRKTVEAFLVSCLWSEGQIAEALAAGQSACPRHRVVVTCGGSLIAFASWDLPRPPRWQSGAWLGIATLHPMVDLASDVLVEQMARDICALHPASALLQGHTRSRYFCTTAVAHGFIPVGPPANPSHFEKLCFGTVLTPRNWVQARAAISNAIGLNLPERPPTYSGPTTRIECSFQNGSPDVLPLSAFEPRFGPTIAFLPDRPSVVVPIQRTFADQLLGTAQQLSFLPRAEASMWQERLYLCSPRALAVLAAGSTIFFYESRGKNEGRGAVVAVAQIVRTAVRKKAVLDAAMTRRGVLTTDEIADLSATEETALVYFSQLMPLKRPIPMSRLRALGCMDAANFVTARHIEERAAWAIIEEGQPNVRLS
jgi:predicted nucleic acid-binding protein